jgi:TetR/AcrR family transcriptional regulator
MKPLGEPDEKKAQVLRRIRPLIEERGYDAVSVEAMAAAAGISKATFYRLFPTKGSVREALGVAGVAPERLDARDGREAILDAATAVFGAQGYAGATVDAIAQAASMSKAGVYWHFESKEAMFIAVIARYAPFAAVARVISEGERAGDDPRAILTGVLTEVVAAVTPRLSLFRTIFIEAIQNPELSPVFVRNVLGVVIPIIGGYLARQVSAGHMRPMHPVLALQSLIGPLFFHLFTREMVASQFTALPPMETVIAHIVQTFLDGAAMPRQLSGIKEGLS